MKIYIQSAGTSPDFDYSWQPEVPSFLSRISGYIQSESPSVVLCRFDGQLFLLVTALESPTKKDFAGRVIRHSVAWLCDENSDNEILLRAITCQALQDRDDLTVKVDQRIQLDRKQGFTFEISQFEDLSKSISNSLTLENLTDVIADTAQIGKNSQDLRNALAEDLRRFRLSSDYELLVIVTGSKSEYSLTQANIWRSLSNMVKSEDWKTVTKAQKEDLSPKKLMLVIALILLILIIGVVIFLTFLR